MVIGDWEELSCPEPVGDGGRQEEGGALAHRGGGGGGGRGRGGQTAELRVAVDNGGENGVETSLLTSKTCLFRWI